MAGGLRNASSQASAGSERLRRVRCNQSMHGYWVGLLFEVLYSHREKIAPLCMSIVRQLAQSSAGGAAGKGQCPQGRILFSYSVFFLLPLGSRTEQAGELGSAFGLAVTCVADAQVKERLTGAEEEARQRAEEEERERRRHERRGPFGLFGKKDR